MLRHRKKHNVAFENDNGNNSDDDNAPEKPPTEIGVGPRKTAEKTDDSDGTEGGDLISNLLGIRDRSIIDQVLTASADDAAKLLGVKNGREWKCGNTEREKHQEEKYYEEKYREEKYYEKKYREKKHEENVGRKIEEGKNNIKEKSKREIT